MELWFDFSQSSAFDNLEDGELQTTAFNVKHGKIVGIYVMRNPDKRAHIAAQLRQLQ